MPLSFTAFIDILISLLTAEERQGCLAYAAEQPLRRGESLQFPGIRVEVTTPSYLAFIDRQPGANWAHPARYVIVPRQSLAGQAGRGVQSIETRLPPFQSENHLHWRLIYQGPGVPDALVAQFSTKSKSSVRKEP